MQSRLAVDDHWQQATQMTARVSQAMQPKVFLCWMLFLLQPSLFPGLRLAHSAYIGLPTVRLVAYNLCVIVFALQTEDWALHWVYSQLTRDILWGLDVGLAVDGVMVMDEELAKEVEHSLATHVSNSFSLDLMLFSG